MDKFLIKRPRFPSSTNTHVLNLNSAADSNAFIPDTNTPTQKRANIEFNPDSIISDPGARIPIDEYDVNIRDQVRRAYIAKGPFRPVDYTFPKNGDSRTFQANWFGEFDWLEYSIHKDAAFCMWCYLFNPKRADNSGKNAFTTTGFKKWKKALNKFRSHIGLVGSSHNEATRRYQAFKNQKQSISMRNDEGLSKLQNIGDLAVMMVRTHRHTAYPLVYQLVELALVLPVATATVERVFSAMKILKTYQRNRIGDEWLNDSMMVYIEKTVFAKVDNEAVLQNYQNMQSRRIQLSSITSSTKNSSSVGN